MKLICSFHTGSVVLLSTDVSPYTRERNISIRKRKTEILQKCKSNSGVVGDWKTRNYTASVHKFTMGILKSMT